MRLRFSSDAVPAQYRKDAIDAALGSHVRGTVDFSGEAPPSVALDLQTLASVHLARIETSPIRLDTPPADDGVVYLSITSMGGGTIDARGEGRAVRVGDFNVMRRDRRCTTVVAQRSHIVSIAVPRAQLVPRLTSEDCLHAPAVRSRSAARLLECYAQTLFEDGGDIAPEEAEILAGHVVDLAVMAIGPGRDDAESAENGGVRAARRRAIKADVAANLGVAELSIEAVARRHRISSAYVRALFYDEGTSFTDYVLGERLDHVHGLLCSAYLANSTIANLALMAGFSDISWFNQAFRRRFGATPSDVRNAGAALTPVETRTL